MSVYLSPWSLDKLLGLWYRATSGPAVARVCRPRERCFVVSEEPPLLPQRQRTRYCVYALVKRGRPSLQAASLLKKALRTIATGKPLLFGFKDTEATTLQYVCISCRRDTEHPLFLRLGEGSLWARLVGYVKKCREQPPLGNKFWIILEPLSTVEETMDRISKLKGKLLPNYYGYQRFGTRRPNTHLLGLALLARDPVSYLDEFLDSPYPDESSENKLCRLRRWRGCDSALYESFLARKAHSLRDHVAGLSRKILSLYASALQAYLFNLYLSLRIEKGYELSEPIKGERGKTSPPLALVPGIGYRLGIDGEARRILEYVIESVGINRNALEKPFPVIGKVRPYWRPVALLPRHLGAKKLGNRIVLSFELGPGEYATIVLRELVKIPDGL